MSSQEEIESREEQRLSRALQGKVGTNTKGRVTSWAPVVTKPTPTVPVNYSGAATGGGVDTQSPYANVAGISDEKMRQEQARLKKWGLDTGNVPPAAASTGDEQQISSSQSTPSLESANLDDQARGEERRLTKMGLSSTNLIEEYGTPAPKPAPVRDDIAVDNASIAANIDALTSEEKVRAEQKRLERWGLKINSSTPSPAAASPAVVSPKSNPVTTPAAPVNPYNNSAAAAVAKQYGLTVEQVQPFLDQLIFATKSVKLVIHKKSSNHDVTINTLMDIVRESATFALTLPADLPIGFDISQSAGRLAGAVNELVKSGDNREPAQTLKLYEEIQALLGLLYMGVVAN